MQASHLSLIIRKILLRSADFPHAAEFEVGKQFSLATCYYIQHSTNAKAKAWQHLLHRFCRSIFMEDKNRLIL